MGRLTEFFRYTEDLDNKIEDEMYCYLTLEKGCFEKKYKRRLIFNRNKALKKAEKEKEALLGSVN